jgi:methylenetetrahydrofolate dehydrogenase (NADP+) / methenyltetrahydrofolate cyclohydrolase
MSTTSEPFRTTMALQLDYFMSAQFAGVAVALRRGLYEAAQLDVSLLPECPPGAEPQHVLAAQVAQPEALCVGTIEQNVLAPWAAAVAAAPDDGVTAVGAMFGRSPLCLAALPATAEHGGSAAPIFAGAGAAPRVGAHEDTVALLKRLLPRAAVLVVPRADKLKMLRAGELDAVQIYDCMEAIALQRELGEGAALRLAPFDTLASGSAGGSGDGCGGGDAGGGSGGVALGYAQTVFAPTAALREGDARRGAMRRFMAATFEGWRLAISDPAGAAADVLALQPTGIDHFDASADSVAEAVRRCCGYVKRTSAGGMLGVIDPAQWDSANRWLLGPAAAARAPSLEPALWAPDARLMLGSRLAPSLLAQAKAMATRAGARLGRRPRLCVVTVGTEPLGAGHRDGAHRLEVVGIPDASWFDKPAAGAAVGIDVEEVSIPAEGATTEQLVAVLRDVRERADGIQLMWPLPPQVDAATVYAAVPRELDADGCSWLAQMELAGGQHAVLSGQRELLHNAPVTAAAVIRLLDHHGEPIAGKRVLIVGRSRLCGSPLAFMFGARGALVTSAHSQTVPADLQAACLEADIVVPCVGRPGLIAASWIKPGAVVVNVGTAFVDGMLVPDIPADIAELAHAKRVSSCPNGVGPLSCAVLLLQTAACALERAPKPVGAMASTLALSATATDAWVAAHPGWALASRQLGGQSPPTTTTVLRRSFHFPSYPRAATFVASAAAAAEQANHHPNLSIVHSCTEGVDIAVELFTYATNSITAFDTEAAATADIIFGEQTQTHAQTHAL